VGEVLRASVLLAAAAVPLAARPRWRRWWPLPFVLVLAVLADEIADLLDVSHPGARIGAGIVVVALAVWHLTLGSRDPAPQPAAPVAAVALGLALEDGAGDVALGAVLATVVVLALPLAGRERLVTPLSQLADLVLTIGGVGLVLSGIFDV
jgi:hypothetical protein